MQEYKGRRRIYSAWCHMKSRCFNTKDKNYSNYGGRGITICEEWLNSFENFYQWALNNGYDDNLTIDRIDCNNNYTPSNCKWSSPKEQSNNRRSNQWITFNEETHTIKQWSEKLGIDYKRLYARLMYEGFSIEEAFELQPKITTYKQVWCDGILFNSITECAKANKVNSRTMSSWLDGTRIMPSEWEKRGLRLYTKNSTRSK